MNNNLIERLSKSDILNKIYEYNNDAILIFNNAPGRLIADCNDAAVRIFGFDREELIGKSVDTVCKDDLSGSLEELSFCEAGKNGFLNCSRFRMNRKDGCIFTAEHRILSVADDSGEAAGWVSIIRDISEIVQAEEETAVERTRLSAHLNAASIAMITLDTDGRIDFVNSYGRSLLELDDRDVTELNWFDEFIPGGKEEETISLFYNLLSESDGKGKSFVNTINTCRGRRITVGWYAAVYYDKHDAFSGYILRGVEIANNEELAFRMMKSNESLRQLNSRLHRRREDKMAELTRKIMDDMGQVAAGICFEVSILEKIIRKDDIDNKKPEISNKLKEIGETLNYLIQFGRELSSGIRPAALDDIGLAATLRWYACEFEKKTGIRCVTEQISGGATVEKEPAIILFRICEEIFENIKIHSRADRVDILLHEKEGFLILKIVDNGIGISGEAITTPASLGLLRISENVRDLGGTFAIHGENEGGTSILIRIPVKKIQP